MEECDLCLSKGSFMKSVGICSCYMHETIIQDVKWV